MNFQGEEFNSQTSQDSEEDYVFQIDSRAQAFDFMVNSYDYSKDSSSEDSDDDETSDVDSDLSYGLPSFLKPEVAREIKIQKSRGYDRGLYGDISAVYGVDTTEHFFDAPCDADVCIMKGQFRIHCEKCGCIFHTACASFPNHDYGEIICIGCPVPDSEEDQ